MSEQRVGNMIVRGGVGDVMQQRDIVNAQRMVREDEQIAADAGKRSKLQEDANEAMENEIRQLEEKHREKIPR